MKKNKQTNKKQRKQTTPKHERNESKSVSFFKTDLGNISSSFRHFIRTLSSYEYRYRSVAVGEAAATTGCSRPRLGSLPAGCFERRSVTAKSTERAPYETEQNAPQSVENGIIRSGDSKSAANGTVVVGNEIKQKGKGNHMLSFELRARLKKQYHHHRK